MSCEYNCTGLDGVSPAVLYDNKTDKFYVWYVDINEIAHRLMRCESKDGIHFNNKTVMDATRLYKEPWHLDIVKNEHEHLYYILMTFAGVKDLYLACAQDIDGDFVLFQREPIVYCSDICDDISNTSSTYRSTGAFNETTGDFNIWTSAQRDSTNMWHVVHTKAKHVRYKWIQYD
jgi:hypothetical protein